MKQKIVYVDGFHIRNVFGDMDFNMAHGPWAWYKPWFIPPGETWIEKRFRDEARFWIKNETLEQKLYRKIKNYRRVREIISRKICRPAKKKIILRSFRHKNAIVRIVDGDALRRSFDYAFIMGGHHFVYPHYIPKGEIWLDEKIAPRELTYILVHEEQEYKLMKQGMNYGKAHELACAAEKEARAKDAVADYLIRNPINPLPFISLNKGAKRKIIIVSGAHGDEPSGAYALVNTLREKTKTEKIYKGANFDIVPIINSYGWERRTRTDKNGKDPNRYFGDRADKKSPKECIMLKNFFKTITKPYTLLISLHEDPKQKKFYLYDAGNGKNSPLVKNIFRAVKKTGVQLYTGIDDPNDPLLNQMVMNGYIAVGPNNPAPTLEDYLVRNKKVKRAITLEIPGLLPLDKKVHLAEQLIACVTKNIQ